jgi:hypothetical protein
MGRRRAATSAATARSGLIGGNFIATDNEAYRALIAALDRASTLEHILSGDSLDSSSRKRQLSFRLAQILFRPGGSRQIMNLCS